MELSEILKKCQNNNVIYDSFIKAHDILFNHGYQNIMVSVSGGADSDIMVDMCEKLGLKYITSSSIQESNTVLLWNI